MIFATGNRKPDSCIRVIGVASSAVRSLPLFTRLPTYRCVALTDMEGHRHTSRGSRSILAQTKAIAANYASALGLIRAGWLTGCHIG